MFQFAESFLLLLKVGDIINDKRESSSLLHLPNEESVRLSGWATYVTDSASLPCKRNINWTHVSEVVLQNGAAHELYVNAN